MFNIAVICRGRNYTTVENMPNSIRIYLIIQYPFLVHPIEVLELELYQHKLWNNSKTFENIINTVESRYCLVHVYYCVLSVVQLVTTLMFQNVSQTP